MYIYKFCILYDKNNNSFFMYPLYFLYIYIYIYSLRIPKALKVPKAFRVPEALRVLKALIHFICNSIFFYIIYTVDILFSKIQETKDKKIVPLHSNIFVKKIGFKEMNVKK